MQPSEDIDIELPSIYKMIEPSKSQTKLEIRLTDEEAALKRMRNILKLDSKKELNRSCGSEGEIESKIEKVQTHNFSNFSPRNILLEVKDIEQKIKRVKTAEKRAGTGNKANLIDVPMQFRFHKRPWGVSKFISRETSKELTRPSTTYKTTRNFRDV